MTLGTGWTLATGDQVINKGQTLLYGLLLSSKNGEGEASIYEGLDTTSGRLIFKFVESDEPIIDINFDQPLRLERGLYVDFGSKMNAILFRWLPLIDGKLPGERAE